ncbi:NUDIX domain-containing protein [Vibrio sp. MA40-2]|uniref:NUDIX domain-containing protein n=1 Tax=Vibrio sp. MA40-2 TaxID=3391828 RepID=UPI0039A72DF3
MKVHECVSFLLIDGDKVLLEKRSDNKELSANSINIPGGHIEQGESQVQALCREINEELQVVPISYNYLCSLYHPTSEFQLLHYYVVDRWVGNISAQEADQVEWHDMLAAPVEIEADKLALSEYQRVSPYLR